MNGDEAYVLSKALTSAAVAGIKNYNISDTGLLTMETSDGQILTFQFTQPEDGVSVVSVDVDNNKHLVITYSDGRVETTPGIVPTVKGDKGDTGEDGKSFSIKAQYATYEQLIAAHPTGQPGDAFFVGTDNNPDLYIWLEDDNEWMNNGPIKGVKGDPGFSPSVELERKSNGVEITVTNESGSESAMVYDGGGNGAELQDDLTTAISVGGIASGVTYEAGTPLEDLWRDLLEPTLYPTFTAPSATITYSANTYYAVGGTVAAATATVGLSRGSISPAYGTSGKRAGAATGYAVQTTGADTEYSDSGSTSAFSVPALTRATKGTIVVTGTANYAAGEQPKDSKGNDYSSPLPAGSVSASKTLTFIQPYYYGISNTSSISDFAGLTENVTAKGQKTFSYTTNNQYMVMAYDSSYGNIKTILDGNGFDVTGGWTKSTLTVGGFSYFVYVANSPTTDTNAPFTFKY